MTIEINLGYRLIRLVENATERARQPAVSVYAHYLRDAARCPCWTCSERTRCQEACKQFEKYIERGR